MERPEEVDVGVDRLRPEPPAEDVVVTTVSPVELACVAAVEHAHARGEPALGEADHEVEMVRHQAVGEHLPPEPIDDQRDGSLPDTAVRVVSLIRARLLPRVVTWYAQPG